MKKIFLFLFLVGVGFFAKAQTNPFPTTDSLERFINRWIRNSAVEAFQNLRLNTAMIGMLRFIQNSEIGSGVDTMYLVGGCTIRLTTSGGDTINVSLCGKLDSVTIETATDPSPDTLYEWRGASRSLVGLIPKGGGSSGDTTYTEKPIYVKTGDDDTLAVAYDGTTVTIDNDSALSVNTTNISTVTRLADTAAAIRADFPAVSNPTLQNVTDAGQVTNDSVRMRTLTLDSALYLAVRRGADSIGMAQRRGLIMYDSVTGSLLYRGESFWTYLATLSNSLIPNRPNMRLIAGVLRPTVSAPNVVWNWIIDAEHDSIGFGAITCDGANVVLNLTTPATKIHTIIPVPDETLAGYIDVGASFQTDKAMLRIRRRIGVANGYIQGNGTTYTATGSVTPTYTTATGNLLLDWVSAYATPANGVSVIYTGRNGYHVEKEFSAFGGADRRYTVVDAFGNPVTIAPTSDDVIEIVTPDWTFADINPCSSNGSDWAAAILGSSFGNIWVIGLIEY